MGSIGYICRRCVRLSPRPPALPGRVCPSYRRLRFSPPPPPPRANKPASFKQPALPCRIRTVHLQLSTGQIVTSLEFYRIQFNSIHKQRAQSQWRTAEPTAAAPKKHHRPHSTWAKSYPNVSTNTPKTKLARKTSSTMATPSSKISSRMHPSDLVMASPF